MTKPKPVPEVEAAELLLGPTVRRLRLHAGWTLAQLAEAARISPAAVFKIEKGTMTPSITILLRIARALDRSVEELLSPEVESPYQVLKVGERAEVRFRELPIAIERLVGKLPDRHLECGIYAVKLGGASDQTPLSHEGEKLYYVLDGSFRFWLGGRTVLLGIGDAVHLKASVPHRWENTANGEARLLFVVTPPPLFRPSAPATADLAPKPASKRPLKKKAVKKSRGRS
jgi:transcriptional regulator with XRE-family HTH domain